MANDFFDYVKKNPLKKACGWSDVPDEADLRRVAKMFGGKVRKASHQEYSYTIRFEDEDGYFVRVIR